MFKNLFVVLQKNRKVLDVTGICAAYRRYFIRGWFR